MLRTGLKAALACLLTLAPATADAPRLTALGDLSFSWLNLDGPASDDINVFAGSGSALWSFPGNWNVQGDYSFASYRYDGPNTVDQWKFGGGVFWRDPASYAVGGQLFYQSLDTGVENDGIALAVHGEIYWEEATLALQIGHSGYDGPALDNDGWQLAGKGTWYASPQVAWRAGLSYGAWDDNGVDIDAWELSGEVDYLIPEYATSVYAGIALGSQNPDGADNTDTLRVGIGVRLHLGTQGSLRDRNRAEPMTGALRTEFTF